MIAAFALDDAMPSTGCPLADPRRLLQLTPRNTEPSVDDRIGNHHIRTTTQIVDGVVRITMKDFCCAVEAVTERTLTELLVWQGAKR